jgi:hypothetical protein
VIGETGRFLRRVLPSGFHRIRHYGLLAAGARAADIAGARTACRPVSPEPPDTTTPGPPVPQRDFVPGLGIPASEMHMLGRIIALQILE